MSGSAPVRMAVGVAVVTFATVASVGVPMVSASAVSGSGSWFHDPVSAAGRAAEVAVPRHPARTIGDAVRHTRATYRARSGSLAVPIAWARGHQLTSGQAVVMGGSSFSYDHGNPTAGTRRAIRSLTRSLTAARSVRCEGYADFGGAPGGERPLSLERARAVCAVIARNTSGVSTQSVGYGIFRPVVIGGRHAGRAENRRVVVKVTRSGQVAHVPDAPHLSRVVAARTSATVRFERPASDGGAAIVRYQVSLNGGTSWRNVSASGPGPFSVAVTGLTAGTRYTVAVRAVNRIGDSPRSNLITTRTTTASGPAVTVPDPPHLSTAVPAQTSITAGFERPAEDGGSAITGYQASVDGGATWRNVPGTGAGPFSVQLTGLTPASSYTVAVRAVNSVGTSARSNTIITATNDTPPASTPPTPPFITSVSAETRFSDGQPQTYDTIEFDAPTSDGGSPITGYQWSTDAGATWTDLAYTGSNPYSGEVREPVFCGGELDYVIRAVNSAGGGEPSNTVSVFYCP